MSDIIVVVEPPTQVVVEAIDDTIALTEVAVDVAVVDIIPDPSVIVEAQADTAVTVIETEVVSVVVIDTGGGTPGGSANSYFPGGW